MSRYFNADTFFETFGELNTEPYNNFPKSDVVELDILTDVCVRCIQNEQPTAEVVEVVRGEWIQHDEGVYQEKEKNWWHCSNCGNVIYSEHEDDRKEFHKWCGRCGAYMRGEDDAE